MGCVWCYSEISPLLGPKPFRYTDTPKFPWITLYMNNHLLCDSYQGRGSVKGQNRSNTLKYQPICWNFEPWRGSLGTYYYHDYLFISHILIYEGHRITSWLWYYFSGNIQFSKMHIQKDRWNISEIYSMHFILKLSIYTSSWVCKMPQSIYFNKLRNRSSQIKTGFYYLFIFLGPNGFY